MYPSDCRASQRSTGKVLDHFCGKSIQAYNGDETHPNHQWRRVPTSEGFVAYRNVATGKVLDHYGGRRIDACDDTVADHHRQWQEVNVGNGFVAIKNRATGQVLDHWYGNSIQAYNGDVNHVNHQWHVVRMEPHSESPDDVSEDSLLDDVELADKMLIILPDLPDEKRGGGWWPKFPIPFVDAGPNSRRQFSVGGFLHYGIPTIVRILLQRFHDINEYVQSDEPGTRIEIDRMYPLFRPMRNSHGVQLFAHHDIVLTMVQLLDHYRSSGDALAQLFARRGDAGAWPPLAHLIRANGNAQGESLGSFLSRLMTPAIVETIWSATRRRRGSDSPTLASLTLEERSQWRRFVPLPIRNEIRGINSESRRPYQDQTAPLTLWEIVVLFFRIIEAQLEIEHGVRLSRFSLHYNGILIALDPESRLGSHEFRLIRGGELEVLRSEWSNTEAEVGMWHVITFSDVLEPTDPRRIADFSVVFVLHTSDPYAELALNPGGSQPFTFPPVGTVNHNGFNIHPRAQNTTGAHYHLATIPGD